MRTRKDPEKVKQGRRNRQYGHSAERELARDLRAKTGWPAERIVSESKYGNLGDVIFKPGSQQIVFQVKSGKRPSVTAAIEESDEATAGNAGKTPMGLLNFAHGPGQDRQRIVVMHLEYFVALVLRAEGKGPLTE